MNDLIQIISMFLSLSIIDGDISRKDINCTARAVYHEARGETIQGQIAVAYVILNRVKSSIYPDNICSVVYQPSQFSGLKHNMVIEDRKAWRRAVEVSIMSYSGFIDDPTGGALWYYAHNIITAPYWAVGMIPTAIIGNHMFWVKL